MARSRGLQADRAGLAEADGGLAVRAGGDVDPGAGDARPGQGRGLTLLVVRDDRHGRGRTGAAGAGSPEPERGHRDRPAVVRRIGIGIAAVDEQEDLVAVLQLLRAEALRRRVVVEPERVVVGAGERVALAEHPLDGIRVAEAEPLAAPVAAGRDVERAAGARVAAALVRIVGFGALLVEEAVGRPDRRRLEHSVVRPLHADRHVGGRGGGRGRHGEAEETGQQAGESMELQGATPFHEGFGLVVGGRSPGSRAYLSRLPGPRTDQWPACTRARGFPGDSGGSAPDSHRLPCPPTLVRVILYGG